MSVFFTSLGLFVPGSVFFISNRKKTALIVTGLGVVWLLLICWTRLILSPIGLVALPVGLLVLHAASWILGCFLVSENNTTLKLLRAFFALALLQTFLIFIFFSKKELLLGFGVYQIPSISMYPTLIPGDVILVDTWAFKKNSPAKDQIVLFKNASDSLTYIKRVTATNEEDHKWLDNNQQLHQTSVPINYYFVEGDNKKYSKDSRNFGAIEKERIFGKAVMIILSVGKQWKLRNERTFKLLDVESQN